MSYQNRTKLTSWIMAAFLGVLFCALPSTGHADDILAEIKKRGQFNVATEAAYPPFEFMENGKITGYSKHILDHIVSDMGVELNQIDLPFQGILPGLLANKYDFVATSVSINAKRAKNYAYTRPIGTNQNVIVVRHSDDKIKDADGLAGVVVATQLASSMEPVAKEHSAKLKAEGKEGYGDLKLFQAIPETFVALASSQVDAVIVGSVQAAVVMKKRPNTFKIVSKLGNPRFLAWVAKPEDKALRDYVNVQIGKLVESGKIAEWQDKWFGFRMDMPSEGYLPEGAH